MKLACASASLHRDIERGDLTQLEFIDLCARELPCDGVVLDVRHFPRFDDQYLAQVKKMAADCGLDIAALADAEFFTRDEAEMRATFGAALATGAPLLATQLSLQTARSWSEESASIGAATSAAKTANVTLAVRNVPDTYAGSSNDVKRAFKESDSAWMRLALDGAQLEDTAELGRAGERVVLLWASPGATWLAGFAQFRGFAVLDGDYDAASIGGAARELRAAIRATEA